MKNIETSNDDLEFGLIDNDGSFNLLDDEESNMVNDFSDEEMTFENLIGEATSSERNDQSFSTTELKDLSDVINMVDDSLAESDYELDSVDTKTMDLNDLGLDKIEDEEVFTEQPEVTDNTVSLDDLDLAEEELEIEPEEEQPIEEPVAPEEEITEEPVVEEEEEEVDAEEALDITSDLSNLEEALNDEESPFNVEATNLEDEIQVSEDYNIDDLFDKASKNAKEASNIFSQNLELRKQIDDKYNKLVKLSEEQEQAKQQALKEIEDYKNEVYIKLKEQKSDVEAKIEELKNLQATFEQEKNEFMQYRNQEIENINASKKEINEQHAAIAIIEEKLVARKNDLDAERERIRSQREQFEIEKRNLRANLKRFNELVGGFTTGVEQVTGQNNEGNL